MRKPSGVLIIPTGLDCALGGDAGFNPGVKLIAACCRRLVVNPNAVNASDVNEMPDNCLYVEGSHVDSLLAGRVALREVRQNRILMAVNPPISPYNVNSLNAGAWGIGADIELAELRTPLSMRAAVLPDGSAGGEFSGVDELVDQVRDADFDALAVQTPIDCDPTVADRYWREGGVNPWGRVEAMVSARIAQALGKPVAHAPCDAVGGPALHRELVVDRQMAPEVISSTYTFCILKGLHRAPRIVPPQCGSGIVSREDVSFLVTPHGCWGPPHAACAAAGIPIVVVRENTTCFSAAFEYPAGGELLFAENYLEAAGIVSAMSAGVDPRIVLLRTRSLDRCAESC